MPKDICFLILLITALLHAAFSMYWRTLHHDTCWSENWRDFYFTTAILRDAHIFPFFFLCLTYRLSKRGRGRWRAICSCPFFFFCYACYLFVALFCVFRLLFLPEWEHNDKAILCACFLFFFFLKSSVALVYVFTTSVAKRYPTTGPLLSFLLLFCYMCLLMWVFALVMRVFFFSWTWVLLKIMKERRRKKNLNYIINSFPPFYMLNVIVFFFSRSFFFFTLHINWLADTYYFPHRYCWQMDIYTIFSLLRSETLNFHARTPPSFMWEGKRGLFFVCSTARFFDTATHRKDWKEEQVESALSIHCFFF